MVQLRRSEAGFKLAEGEDDGIDLCLAQASLVLIRLEERMRAAARHLSSCRMKGAQCSLWRSVDRPNQHDYAVFGDSGCGPREQRERDRADELKYFYHKS